MEISHPVARTAFYCCVIRADDAAGPDPICGDTFAARFVDEQIRRDLAPATRLRSPAVSNVARHRMVDDLVRDALASDPGCRVILIGAGFDTRAYRLRGGRYVEIDDPSLLAFKEQRLPAADAPNPLDRMPVVFQSESPGQYLGRLAGSDRALVILEGVSMYLTDDALRQLAAAVMRHLPHGTLVCDLMSAAFSRRFGRALRKAFTALGATFGNQSAQPSEIFVRAGMTPVTHRSIPGYASQLGRLPIPRWVLNTLLRELRDGYQLWVFRWNAPGPA
jgi:methyltransferase (TIGR00027 family)